MRLTQECHAKEPVAAGPTEQVDLPDRVEKLQLLQLMCCTCISKTPAMAANHVLPVCKPKGMPHRSALPAKHAPQSTGAALIFNQQKLVQQQLSNSKGVQPFLQEQHRVLAGTYVPLHEMPPWCSYIHCSHACQMIINHKLLCLGAHTLIAAMRVR